MGVGLFAEMGVPKRQDTLLSMPGATPSLKSLDQARQSPVSPCCPSSFVPGHALKAPLGLGLAACSQPRGWGSCFPGSLWLSRLSVLEMEG